MNLTICALVEGLLDEAVAQKLIAHVGATPGEVYGKQGKAYIIQRLPAYNRAAQRYPWFVLVDLDLDADCAPQLRAQLLPQPARLLCLRIAVRAVEAWLMADKEAISRFLSVPLNRIPSNPEMLQQPKKEIVAIARNSRRRDIREDMVPRPESGRSEGPAYTLRMIEFVQDHWRPDIAANSAPSLKSALECLKRLVRVNP